MRRLFLEDLDGDTLEVEEFDKTHLLVTVHATNPSSMALYPAQARQLIETCEKWLGTKEICPNCGHSLHGNEHGLDQNDDRGSCTYCRECRDA